MEKQCVAILPDISWADIYNYLTSSACTHENLKAHKSLEVFNFFVCNHVQDVFYHSISKELKFCCVKIKVKGKVCDLKNACEWVHFSVKFQAVEVWGFTNNNEFFPAVFQGFCQNNK